MVDKYQAIIDYLNNCPQIQQNPLFFNFSEAKDNAKQLMIVPVDKVINQPYIDGSVLKRYTFTIYDYRSITYQALAKISGYPNENKEELLDVQAIIDWVTEQNDSQNFPDFGPDCIIDSIDVSTNTPALNSVDTTLTPALAKYSITIVVDYLDISKSNIRL
ncbi:MAG: hypothetical protein J6W84_06195 [Bacteroidales bacterium]|nr:hypothetical protein [Bacteroidales bacterium]